MLELDPEQKLFIVERLAQFATPTQVQTELKKRYAGLDVPLQNLSAYDPGTVAGKRLSDEMKTVFDAARAAFLEDRGRIGLAHANYRLQRLQNLIDDPNLSKSPDMVIRIVEIVERIEGGMFRPRESGATPAQVAAYIAEVTDVFLAAVKEHVTEPEQRARVARHVKTELAKRG